MCRPVQLHQTCKNCIINNYSICERYTTAWRLLPNTGQAAYSWHRTKNNSWRLKVCLLCIVDAEHVKHHTNATYTIITVQLIPLSTNNSSRINICFRLVTDWHPQPWNITSFLYRQFWRTASQTSLIHAQMHNAVIIEVRLNNRHKQIISLQVKNVSKIHCSPQ